MSILLLICLLLLAIRLLLMGKCFFPARNTQTAGNKRGFAGRGLYFLAGCLFLASTQMVLHAMQHRPAPMAGPRPGSLPLECPPPAPAHFQLLPPLFHTSPVPPQSPLSHTVLKPVPLEKPELKLPELKAPQETPQTSTLPPTCPGWVLEAECVVERDQLDDYLHGLRDIPASFIVASGRWSTDEEAIEEADQMISQLITAKMQLLTTQAQPYTRARVPEDLLARLQPYIERPRVYVEPHLLQLSDGMEAKMVRVYREVTLTPEGLRLISREMRQETATRRLIQTGTTIGLVSLLCGAGSLLLVRQKKS